MDIKDRIIEFLRVENISPANFAQEIGVQASGISHIMSGRNKPSLDFILKMLNRYPSLSTEWLLFGKGNMLSGSIPSDLFGRSENSYTKISDQPDLFDVPDASAVGGINMKTPASDESDQFNRLPLEERNKASRIVIFYRDNTFREFFPG